MKNFDFHIAHIGINQENEEAALSAARTFETLFGFSYTVGNSSIFTADKRIEIMKKYFVEQMVISLLVRQISKERLPI